MNFVLVFAKKKKNMNKTSITIISLYSTVLIHFAFFIANILTIDGLYISCIFKRLVGERYLSRV